MTNREWVNGLSNEQYVKFIKTIRQDHCTVCAYSTYYNDEDDCDCGYCPDGYLEWLESEHDPDIWEEGKYRYNV